MTILDAVEKAIGNHCASRFNRVAGGRCELCASFRVADGSRRVVSIDVSEATLVEKGWPVLCASLIADAKETINKFESKKEDGHDGPTDQSE